MAYNVTARLITPIMSDALVTVPTFGAGLYGSNRSLLKDSIVRECQQQLNSVDGKWVCSDIRFIDGVCCLDVSCRTRDGLFCHFNGILIQEGENNND